MKNMTKTTKKYLKKMALKVTERILVIAVIYFIFKLFDVRLTIGM